MDFSRICIVAGVALLVIGITARLLPKGFEPFSWFGKLPGDISYTNDSVTVWIPITSMVLVSVVASVIAKIVAQLFGE